MGTEEARGERESSAWQREHWLWCQPYLKSSLASMTHGLSTVQGGVWASTAYIRGQQMRAITVKRLLANCPVLWILCLYFYQNMSFIQFCPEKERSHHLLTIHCVLRTRSFTDLISFPLPPKRWFFTWGIWEVKWLPPCHSARKG